MPLTAADIDAMARARQLPPLTTQAYLEWLTLMSVTSPSTSHCLNSDTDEPFTL